MTGCEHLVPPVASNSPGPVPEVPLRSYADPVADAEVQRLRAKLVQVEADLRRALNGQRRVEAMAATTVGKYEGFKGCTDRDPDYCDCGTHSDPECEGCGETVEEGEEIVTVARVGLPTIDPDHRDQWWDYHTAHVRCTALADPEESE